MDGIIVPGGFGDRGIEGMIQLRSTRVRTTCLLRHLPGHADHGHGVRPQRTGYADANSSEFTPEGQHNVIDLMPDQQGVRRRAARCVWASTLRHHAGHEDGRLLRHDGDRRAPPPPLRVQQRVPRRVRGEGSGHRRYQPDGRLVELWRSRAAISIWARSSTPSSRAARTVHTPCSRASSPPR